MSNGLVFLLVLTFLPLSALGQDVAPDSATTDERTNILPEVIVAGHHRTEKSLFALNKVEMQLSGVRSSDMNFKPVGVLKRLFRLLFPKHQKESSYEKNERILNEYDNYLPPKQTKDIP